MRYSRLFGKTTKTEFRDATLTSHQLLLRGGFIRESVAGRYYFLPLGWRVHEKIKGIIKAEMDAAGAQEMLAPTLHPLELWEETNRTTSASFELMRVTDRREGKFALGGTAEEMFVDLVRNTKPFSRRDLPFNIYQFSTKFRDEMRARGGLLRLREFIMKDAYSFHADAADFQLEYDAMAAAYTRIFARMGLTAHKVEADNGYIGGEYCHEYQVESVVGEGRFFVGPNDYAAHEDVATFKRDLKNVDDTLEALRTVDAVRGNTMEDGVALHGLPLWQQLKDVMFADENDKLVLAIIRGDLDVCEPKLQKLIGALTLRPATEEEIRAIGSEPGFICPTGLEKKVKIVADLSLRTVRNLYGGANAKHRDQLGLNIDRDFTAEIEGDIAMAYDGAEMADGSGRLTEKRGVEVGNIFQLGTHYTDLMRGAIFTDTDGAEKPFYMGCYGIGLARTLATIIEMHHDDRGIIWPESVAPFQVFLANLGQPGDATTAEAEKLYAALQAAGAEVLFDDRDNRAGEKFADADLLGLPYRVVVSTKTLAAGGVELKKRNESDCQVISVEKLLQLLSA